MDIFEHSHIIIIHISLLYITSLHLLNHFALLIIFLIALTITYIVQVNLLNFLLNKNKCFVSEITCYPYIYIEVVVVQSLSKSKLVSGATQMKSNIPSPIDSRTEYIDVCTHEP